MWNFLGFSNLVRTFQLWQEIYVFFKREKHEHTITLSKQTFWLVICDIFYQYCLLLYYCPSRWLSYGGALSHTFQLWQEIYAFFEEEKYQYAKRFVDIDFLIKLMCLKN